MNNTQKVNKLFSANAKETEIILKNNEIDVDIVNDYGKTSLFNARKDKMEILLKYGANIDHRDYKSNTPLLTAINLERFLFLLESGADVNAENVDGFSCLKKISMMKDMSAHESVKLLKEKGFDFIGGKVNESWRLTNIYNIEIWKEMFIQNCIDEVPRYSFVLTGEESVSLLERKESLFLKYFAFRSDHELIDYFFKKDEGLFSFVMQRYNNDLRKLKKDFYKELEPVFDFQMLKMKVDEEKKLLLSNLNKPKDLVNTNKKRL